MLYHVTPMDNLQSILESGLEPAIGPRSAELGEIAPCVYLFRSLEDVETALMNWLGEALEDVDELVILEIEPDQETASRLQSTERDFEVCCDAVIPASCVTRLFDEKLNEVSLPRKSSIRPGA